MRKLLVILLLAGYSFHAVSQPPPAVIDSFKRLLQTDITDDKRVEILGNLARTLIYVNIAEADKYGMQAIEIAEASRDRKLMVKALMLNGQRYGYLAGRKDNLEKSISYYNKALELAKSNKLEPQMVAAYLGLSQVTRAIPDAEKSLRYCNEAYSYVDNIKDDSLEAEVHLEFGAVYLLKHEKLLSLRNHLAALRIAEDLKNNNLMRSSYTQLDQFYTSIEDYDKAIDYATKAMNLLSSIKSGQSRYNRVVDLNRIGTLYSYKKDYTLAMNYFERSIALADTLKYEPLKVLSYRSIVDNYLEDNQPQKALDYFNRHPQLKNFLQTVNFGHFIDMSYGYIYMQLGKYDSAKYYYKKVDSVFQKNINLGNLYNYYGQMGKLYKQTGELDKSLDYFTRAMQMATGTGTLDRMSFMAQQLDSIYQKKGDYKQALYYSSLDHRYKDSLASLSKEKDLMQAEAADELQRRTREDQELAAKKNRQHNIQYRVITIGIVSLIIALVMLGMFKVSATTIKMLGFFTFLMLFEFIFLLLKKQSYGLTGGEPWKDLVMMIVLAAVLLPLHHWLEHKVIHYLTSHNRLTASGRSLKQRLFKKKDMPAK